MKFLSALVLFLILAFIPNPALAASPAHQLYDEAASLDRDGFFDEAAAAWEIDSSTRLFGLFTSSRSPQPDSVSAVTSVKTEAFILFFISLASR